MGLVTNILIEINDKECSAPVVIELVPPAEKVHHTLCVFYI